MVVFAGRSLREVVHCYVVQILACKKAIRRGLRNSALCITQFCLQNSGFAIMFFATSWWDVWDHLFVFWIEIFNLFSVETVLLGFSIFEGKKSLTRVLCHFTFQCWRRWNNFFQSCNFSVPLNMRKTLTKKVIKICEICRKV